MGKILKGLSATIIAIIVVVIVVIAAVGIYYGIALTHHPTVTTTTSVTSTVSSVTTSIPSKVTIVFYTWWATEGKVALNHMLPTFESAYTQYTVAPEVLPGGGGVNAFPAIISLIKAGKPPDAFQTHMGPQAFSLIEEFPGGVSAGLKDVVNWTPYYQTYFAGKVIPEVFQAGAFAGNLLSVPTQIHTSSLLYINIKVLKYYGLPIPTNISQLINDTLQLVKDGFYNSTNAPWGISGAEGGWGGLQLWESIFLALGGPRLYNEITYGTLNLSDPHVMQIVNETNTIFAELVKYNLNGWPSMTWQQMTAEISSGHIAFFVMGDWATNYMYDYLNVTTYPALPQYLSNPNVTVAVEPFPQTQNYISAVIDSVGMPSSEILPSTEYQAALTFLKYWASPQGELVWAKWKGESYYLNVSPSIYNAPEQAWAYERAVNASNNSADWVYALADGGLYISPGDTLMSAILNVEEGVYTPSNLVQALNESLYVEEQTWLTANSYGLGYLGFPGQPFGNYLPPWVNSSSGNSLKVASGNTMYKNDNANTNSIMSSNNIIPLSSEFLIFTVSASTTTVSLSISKIKFLIH